MYVHTYSLRHVISKFLAFTIGGNVLAKSGYKVRTDGISTTANQSIDLIKATDKFSIGEIYCYRYISVFVGPDTVQKSGLAVSRAYYRVVTS
jgi:hypothetical protein